ncbi:MAG: hypothetical protein ABIU05_03780, partial [Nitrospirales bacterium]
MATGSRKLLERVCGNRLVDYCCDTVVHPFYRTMLCSSFLFVMFFFSQAGAESLVEQRKNSVSSQHITHEIRYHAPEAGEVWLVWGINGWQQAPDTMRPPGTIVPDKAMQTPMV